MNISTKTRYVIFQILVEVFKKTKILKLYLTKWLLDKILVRKIFFVNNVCLNSMRKSMHCKLILNKFVKSKININESILLSSAIVQIIYLRIKPYAVVNETVNVAKSKNIFRLC